MWVDVVAGFVVALGPLVVFFLLVVSRRATLVLLSIGAAFAWLAGAFVAALGWWVVPPFRSVLPVAAAWGVLATEAARFLFWLVWTKGHQSLAQDAGKPLDNDLSLLAEAVAAGVGFALASSLLYISVLWSAWGPGTLRNDVCFGLSIFVVGALQNSLWNVLQVIWTILAHHCYRQRSWRWLLVAGMHLVASLSSVFNSGEWGSVSGLCVVPVVVQLVMTVGSGIIVLQQVKRVLEGRRKYIRG